jgi:hypothetical protein
MLHTVRKKPTELSALCNLYNIYRNETMVIISDNTESTWLGATCSLTVTVIIFLKDIL